MSDEGMSALGLVQELLGCQWGRQVSTSDDIDPCNHQAVSIVVIHDGDYELCLKLCATHRERVIRETDPHE